MRKCNGCFLELDESCFYKRGKYYRFICKKCFCRYSLKYQKSRAIRFKNKYGFSISVAHKLGLEVAIAVHKRDKNCVFCKTTNDLTVDHIDGNGCHNYEKGLPMNNSLDNLRVLCRSCHGHISGKLNKGRKRGLSTPLIDGSVV